MSRLEADRDRLQRLVRELCARGAPTPAVQAQIAHWQAEIRRIEHMLDHPLRKWRKRRNLSQQALAEMVSVHFQAVRQWEAGRFICAPHHMALLTLVTENDQLAQEWAAWREQLAALSA